MKNKGFLSQIITSGILILSLGFGAEIAQTQEQTPTTNPLLKNACVPSRNGEWGEEKKDISIGREFYTSIMFMNQDSGFTCKISNTQSSGKERNLILGFGIQDNSDYNDAMVTVYLDGKKVGDKSISKGKTDELNITFKKGKSLAIEVTCPTNSCNAVVRFFTVNLEQVKATTNQKPKTPKKKPR